MLMKKLLIMVAAIALVLAPTGLIGQEDMAYAKKSYSSGTKSFKSSTSTPSNSSNFSTTKKQDSTTKTAYNTPSTKASKGGFLKGMLYGGIAGLLLGSLFSNLGDLGAILGLVVNLIGIYVLFMLVKKVISYFNNQKRNKDMRTWRP